MRKFALALGAVMALAGCGSAALPHGAHVVTFTTAGAFPTATITGEYSLRNCARDTRVVTADAREYYTHIAGGLSPADLYYYNLRFAYATFEADGCTPGQLGRALEHGFTQRERAFLFRNLTSSIETAFRAALRSR